MHENVHQIENHQSFLRRLSKRVRPHDLWLIDFAYRLSKKAHEGQLRDDGVTRVFEHARATALILIDEFDITDPDLVVSALIHDTPEDTWVLGIPDIKHVWGERVAGIVDALTKRDDEPFDYYVSRIEKVGTDAMVVKLGDRLHNLRTLTACTKEKRERKIHETRAHFLVPWFEASASLAISLPSEEIMSKFATKIEQAIAAAQDSTSELALR